MCDRKTGLCNACEQLSYICESGRRREGLIARLEADGVGLSAFDEYEKAVEIALRYFTAAGVLQHVVIEVDKNGAPIDEDWFLERGTWAPVFGRIESNYKEIRRGHLKDINVMTVDLRATFCLWAKRHVALERRKRPYRRKQSELKPGEARSYNLGRQGLLWLEFGQ